MQNDRRAFQNTVSENWTVTFTNVTVQFSEDK